MRTEEETRPEPAAVDCGPGSLPRPYDAGVIVTDTAADIRETHTAVVILVGRHAVKLKKPVDLGFLDFSTRAKRHTACLREVELNRRFAPDVYLGVADLHAPDGAVCDHLVVMRRMPEDRRLATLVRAGVPVDGCVRRVARLIAAFHARAERGPAISWQGSRDAILARWSETFDQLRPYAGNPLDEAVAAEVESRTREFLAGRGPLFTARIAAGRVVDGHGDLLANDTFCLDDGPRVLDCIEFSDRLRWLDGLDDAAFLAMDLEHLGTPDLARRFLDWYAEFSADPAPQSLRHHYVAYRAYVRAKVGCLRYGQQPSAATAADVADHAEIARRHLRAGTVRLVQIGGLPGTGKSTLAGRLADRIGAVLLSSDRIRKEIAGLPAESSAWAPYRSGIYSPEWTERTYAELLTRAGRLLTLGETVIVDASWSSAAHRAPAVQLAADTHSELVALKCSAATDVAAGRLDRRGATSSDADPAIAAAMAADADPWPKATTIDTESDVDSCVSQAERLVDSATTPSAT
jgi:uncharacterized protein